MDSIAVPNPNSGFNRFSSGHAEFQRLSDRQVRMERIECGACVDGRILADSGFFRRVEQR
jgi:hypothetical protein